MNYYPPYKVKFKDPRTGLIRAGVIKHTNIQNNYIAVNLNIPTFIPTTKEITHTILVTGDRSIMIIPIRNEDIIGPADQPLVYRII